MTELAGPSRRDEGSPLMGSNTRTGPPRSLESRTATRPSTKATSTHPFAPLRLLLRQLALERSTPVLLISGPVTVPKQNDQGGGGRRRHGLLRTEHSGYGRCALVVGFREPSPTALQGGPPGRSPDLAAERRATERRVTGRAGMALDPGCAALGADVATGVVPDGPGPLEQPVGKEGQHEHGDKGDEPHPGGVDVWHHRTSCWSSGRWVGSPWAVGEPGSSGSGSPDRTRSTSLRLRRTM